MATRIPLLLLIAAWLFAVAGCTPARPPQATYNDPSHHDLYPANLVLTPQQDEQVLALMREAIPPTGPSELRPARYGVRWFDVLPAAKWGVSTQSMAVMTSELQPATTLPDGSEKPEQWIIAIITAADDPVTLTVTREPPPRIYSAKVVAGLFGDRSDLEAVVIREFDAAMRLYGAKRLPAGFDD
ncbi:MAG: hypothetical protein KF724_08675 [Phycisphaeraceae bacterium]|nr:hypothetical protein [Phycisphaeraceae bacterium]